MQKNASPKKAHAQILERNGLNKLTWVVIRELDCVLIVKHRITGPRTLQRSRLQEPYHGC